MRIDEMVEKAKYDKASIDTIRAEAAREEERGKVIHRGATTGGDCLMHGSYTSEVLCPRCERGDG